MKAGRRGASDYELLTTEQLATATAEFDEELVIARSRALTPADRRTWEQARRKPGRPKRGTGVKVISVSVERGLLARSDALARSLGISRAALIERGLEVVLGGARTRAPGQGRGHQRFAPRS